MHRDLTHGMCRIAPAEVLIMSYGPGTIGLVLSSHDRRDGSPAHLTLWSDGAVIDSNFGPAHIKTPNTVTYSSLRVVQRTEAGQIVLIDPCKVDQTTRGE